MGMSVGKKGLKSDINITPYIDILLVLLIIFMVAAPLKKHEERVRVPQPAPPNQQQTVNSDAVIVDVDLDHTIRINQQPVQLENLQSTLSNIYSRRINKNLFIRGESTLAYGEVFKILDIAKSSGVADIALLDKGDRKAESNSSKGDH